MIDLGYDTYLAMAHWAMKGGICKARRIFLNDIVAGSRD